LEGDPRFVVSLVSTPDATRAGQGRFNLGNVQLGCRRVVRALQAVRRERPAALFVSLPKGFASFLWAAAVVGLVGRRVRCCGELAGMRFEFMRSPWQRALALPFLRRFYSIRFLSRGIAEAHARYGFRFPVVFPNGVEAPPAERTEEFARREPMEILYVGSLEGSKGIETILRTAALGRRAGLPLRWVLVGPWGSAACREWAQRYVREERLEPDVAFPGPVSPEARWGYYRRAHVLVHPTVLDGQPLSVLEALSQGVAVVATRVGAIPETIEDGRNGALLSAPDPEEMLCALRGLCEDRARLWRVMRANMEDFGVRFTADRYLRNCVGWLTAAAEDRLADWRPE